MTQQQFQELYKNFNLQSPDQQQQACERNRFL